jgi:hypothetical protein
MIRWRTTLKAIDPYDSEMKTWEGPFIEAPTKKLAREYCDNNGLGYLTIEGQLVAEIPCREGTWEPDWGRRIDYDKEELN